MSRRARFIALQTVLTVVLMGVIVVTLINPKNELALFAVDVPDAGTPVTQGPPTYEPGREQDREPGAGEPGRAEGGPASAEPVGAVVSPPDVAAAGATGALPVAPAPTPDDGGRTGPAGEQYGDTLARLNDAVD